MSHSDTKQTILISLQVEEFQTIIIDCVNACFKHYQSASLVKKEEEEFLTVSQTAELLSLSVPTIYGLIHRRAISSLKRGRRVYFKKQDLILYLEEGRRNAQETLSHKSGSPTNSFKKWKLK